MTLTPGGSRPSSTTVDPSTPTSTSDTAVSIPTRVRVPLPGHRRVTPPTAVILVMAVVSLVLAVTIVFADLDRQAVGLLVIPLTILLLLCGVHVGAAMAIGGLIGIWKLSGPAGLANALSVIPHHSAASWSLTVIPMFILMGIMLYRTGITAKLFDAGHQWLGRVPGGLAVGTNVAGAGLAAASGSTLGISFALGRLAIPEMMKGSTQRTWDGGS